MSKPKIFVAGHRGMVGSSIIRQLKDQEVEIVTRNRVELDLLCQDNVRSFFKNEKIDQVYLAAAKVGGIYANNTYPADFIYQNLMIQSNIIHNAFLGGVKKLLFLGSSCIYPKNINQPIKETELLCGKLEPTNEAYAVSKIAGIIMCQSYNRQYGKSDNIDYRCVMPTNLYGPGDNYHPQNSHVIPGLLLRFHEAKTKNLESVVIWGNGEPRREFLYVDDMAEASIYVMNLKKEIYDESVKLLSHINIGSNQDLTIKELAETLKEVVGYKGHVIYDKSKPNGVHRKLLDSSIINSLGWKYSTSLKEGLIKTYSAFINNKNYQ